MGSGRYVDPFLFVVVKEKFISTAEVSSLKHRNLIVSLVSAFVLGTSQISRPK